MWEQWKEKGVSVHCRTGSLEKNDGFLILEDARSLPYRQLRNS